MIMIRNILFFLLAMVFASAVFAGVPEAKSAEPVADSVEHSVEHSVLSVPGTKPEQLAYSSITDTITATTDPPGAAGVKHAFVKCIDFNPRTSAERCTLYAKHSVSRLVVNRTAAPLEVGWLSA